MLGVVREAWRRAWLLYRVIRELRAPLFCGIKRAEEEDEQTFAGRG